MVEFLHNVNLSAHNFLVYFFIFFIYYFAREFLLILKVSYFPNEWERAPILID